MAATQPDARTAFIALGSNLGDRLAHLRFGLDALGEEPGVSVVGVSPVYETGAVGPPQGAYLNAAAQLSTTLSPRALLDALLSIEARAGRERDPGERYAPRTLDLDLLLYAGLQIDEPGLEVPHPRMCERAFVLIPLAHLAGEVVHPANGRTIAELAAPLAREPGVRRFADAPTPG